METGEGIVGEKSPLLQRHSLSSTFLTLPPALMKERHFALAENVARQHCQTNQGSLVIRFRSESIRPMHLFGHNFDHDYYFELLVYEERDASVNFSVFSCTP
jgi:hypothetical protein